MTIQEKLRLIVEISGLTQEELARKLGVTFVAFNRWINSKAKPRSKAVENINELYKEYSGEKQIPESVLIAKKSYISQKKKAHRNVLKELLANPDIRDQFYLSLTYNTNRIEGSTLSENETAAVLFHNTVLTDKSLVEQLEAKNHQAALDFLFTYLLDKKPIDEPLILKLHAMIMNAVRSDAGNYRSHGVRIVGSYVPTANYVKVPALMKGLVRDIGKRHNDVFAHIADIHSRFEQIHPFSDGNGRVGRLLMHAMAIRNNLAPVVVLSTKERFYLAYLNKAQMKGDLGSLEDFICDAILEGYGILERE